MCYLKKKKKGIGFIISEFNNTEKILDSVYTHAIYRRLQFRRIMKRHFIVILKMYIFMSYFIIISFCLEVLQLL